MSFDPIKALMKNTAPEIKRDDHEQSVLEKFCKDHGIVGMNCGNMNPTAALRMLQGRMGIRSPELNESKKEILHG